MSVLSTWLAHSGCHFPMLIGQFSCSLCNMNFNFQSKLDRHLRSADHRMFENSLRIMEDASMLQDILCAGSAFEEVDHGEEFGVGDTFGVGDVSDSGVDADRTPVKMIQVHLKQNSVFFVDYIDVDVAEILQNIGDFSPFPNKVFALMYFLRNSPKPVVSIIIPVLLRLFIDY